MGTAAIVIDAGGSEDEAIAALLHDAVEDQGGQPTLQRIRAQFGDRCAELVEGVTDTDVKPKPPWKERKEQYLAHLETADSGVLRVSVADKLYNARAILADFREVGDELWGRFKTGREGQLWYYTALAEVFSRRADGSVARDLEATVYELLAEVERVAEL